MPPEEPHGGESVELRAFRGTRRTAVYRDHVLGADAFRRIVGAAQRKRLPLLSSLERRGAQELDKEGARRLAHELTRLVILRGKGEAELGHGFCGTGRSWP